MSYTVFARKYRPQTFDDVVGQEHITRTLRNAIEQNRLAHAYIFVGPRGTGKTSTARILAKGLNCLQSPGPTTAPCGECDSCREIAAGTSMDVLEFDAASNTQVDKVRELIIDNVRYAPTGRFKVYIVDEIHMLSTSSFNALLKTLEEPPAHVKFLFATTDVQKVPMTILSRCQRFDLKRIPTALIAGHLQQIAGKETIQLASAAAEAIARGAEGGMRDAESMLDQLVAFCGNKIEEADVLTVFGITGQETVAGLCHELLEGSAPGALALVHEQAEAGRDLSRLMGDLITHLRNLLVTQADPESLADEHGAETLATLQEQASQVRPDKLLELIEQLGAADGRMRWAPNKKMHFEIAVIRAIQTLGQATLSEVLETLSAMRGGASIEPRSPGPDRGGPAAERKARTPIAKKPVLATPPAARVAEPEQPLPPPIRAAREAAAVHSPVATTPAKIDSAPVPAPVVPEAPRPPATESSPVPEDAPVPEAAQRLAPDMQQPASEPATGDLWHSVIAEVRRKRPLISAWVEAGALLGVEHGTALVGFPPDQSLAAEYCNQANNRKFLEGLLADFAGRSLTLKCQVREGLVVAPTPAATRVEPEAARDPMSDFKDDPLIRKALEIFRAEIQLA